MVTHNSILMLPFNQKSNLKNTQGKHKSVNAKVLGFRFPLLDEGEGKYCSIYIYSIV